MVKQQSNLKRVDSLSVKNLFFFFTQESIIHLSIVVRPRELQMYIQLFFLSRLTLELKKQVSMRTPSQVIRNRIEQTPRKGYAYKPGENKLALIEDANGKCKCWPFVLVLAKGRRAIKHRPGNLPTCNALISL